jgi:hypothetical protein
MPNVQLVQGLAAIVADYRLGEIEPIDADHVIGWVSQFHEDAQDPLLAEMIHVLQRSYFTKAAVTEFLTSIAVSQDLTGGNRRAFWENASVLNVQQLGNSQSELLGVFDEVLQQNVGVGIANTSPTSDINVYIDDVVYGGGHVRSDLVQWIKESAPQTATLDIIVMAYHEGGKYFADTQLRQAAAQVGKAIQIRWRCVRKLEDRLAYIINSDVLRPTRIPQDALVQEYVAKLVAQGFPPVLRNPGQVGAAALFSGEQGRSHLEEQMLLKGAYIRSICPYLHEYQRPLGNMVLRTLGFGSLVVTYRNCANNCPLALWAGDPWVPLFPRKTN